MDRMEPVWALGLMSGTSMDGVDAALVRTDGVSVEAFGASGFLPYAREDLLHLPEVMRDPLRYRGTEVPADRETLADAEAEVVRLHARAVVDLLSDAGVSPEVVGFPGQTAAHAPEKKWTWQLGDGARLALALNRTVVWDFRSDDIRAGGQGAPLAPFYHFALARHLGLREPVAFLNIGGVGNVTWVDPSAEGPEAPGALVAFDTGPGNALVNDWVGARTGDSFDRNGALARAGSHALDDGRAVLATNFVRDFLDRPPPKSLDRNEFATLLARLEEWGTPEGAAVLTAFTAECAAAARAHLPRPPGRWLVCGGGRLNPVLMEMFAERVPEPVMPVEDMGLDGDMLEAQAFAYLAVRVLRGLPTSAPSTTGASDTVSGGRISRR